MVPVKWEKLDNRLGETLVKYWHTKINYENPSLNALKIFLTNTTNARKIAWIVILINQKKCVPYNL